MLSMEHEISVGLYKLGIVESVSIKKSVETLSDEAEIVLPGMYCNKSLGIEKKLKQGDAVEIKLGYNNNLATEFKGYINSISADDSGVKISCIDSLYLFRKKIIDKELKNVTLTALLSDVCQQMGNFQLECDYSYQYDKFVFYMAEGYDVLKKVQEETKANIYFEENVLHVHPPYSKIKNADAVVLDFCRNIEKSELKYMLASDKKVLIKVKGTKPDGSTIETEFGKHGGEVQTIEAGSTNAQNLKTLAQNTYNYYNFDGYEGSVTCWLVPFVEPSYKIKLIDEDYPNRTGIYYVVGTETTFGSSGGCRKIKLGKKISV